MLIAHPERGHRLHWLSEASDEYLGRVYDEASCLLAASYGEGFGLPLIEAAGHGLPLLVRDIPVFREVAGAQASYFQADSSKALASAVRHWLALRSQDLHPGSAGLARTTWDEMAARIKQMLMPVPAENGEMKR
jgi:glycosyltransferase involved in cell wall biosynthesis